MESTYNDDNGNGVKVGENVVGDTAEVHGRAHLGEVRVHLAVGKPENGDPEEDRASGKSTSNLINPGVIKVVPARLVGAKRGRLDRVPHVAVVPVLPGGDGVSGHATTESLEEKLESRAHDVAARGTEDVELLAEDQDGKGNDEHDGGDQVSQPETNVSLSVNHADLTDKRTNVDEEVEPVVDAGGGDSRVNNDASGATGLNTHLLLGNLLGNEGSNVGLESSSSETHDDETENEDTESSVGVLEDRGGGGSDKDNVTDFSNKDRVENSLETTKVGVGNPCTEKGADVDPEGVEGSQAEGNLLAHAQGTGLGLRIVGVGGSASRSREGLGDVVGVYSNGTVVTHTLDQLDKGNLVNGVSVALTCSWSEEKHTVKIFHGILAGTRGRVASSSSVGKSPSSEM